jgi:hypothetical protein
MAAVHTEITAIETGHGFVEVRVETPDGGGKGDGSLVKTLNGLVSHRDG